jgi:chromate reductase, NAD(P)H dehydrogenase (quinone)
LPHFNDAGEVPDIVTAFRNKVKNAAAVLICTPEYAFGVPGSLKNALDWTVSSGEFMNKPVSLITASSQGEKGHAAMLLILSAISAKVVDDATMLITFIRSRLDNEGKVKDPELKLKLHSMLKSLVQAAGSQNISFLLPD